MRRRNLLIGIAPAIASLCVGRPARAEPMHYRDWFNSLPDPPGYFPARAALLTDVGLRIARALASCMGSEDDQPLRPIFVEQAIELQNNPELAFNLSILTSVASTRIVRPDISAAFNR